MTQTYTIYMKKGKNGIGDSTMLIEADSPESAAKIALGIAHMEECQDDEIDETESI